MKNTIKYPLLLSILLVLHTKLVMAQWNTVDVGNSSEVTLFEHTSTSSPVPFNLRKVGYDGNSQSYGLLHLDMGHDNAGGGSNLHYRLKNGSGAFVEYGGLGAYIIDNTAGSEDGALAFYTTFDGQIRSKKMTILNNGNVGIGTHQPLEKFAVYHNGINAYSNAMSIISNTPFEHWVLVTRTTDRSNHSGLLARNDNINLWLRNRNGTITTKINSDQASYFNGGSVGIGTSDPDAKLTVKGDIHAEEVRVDLTVPGPDYVFEEDYDLPTLESLQNYIREHKHLPEIPSAMDMEENGIDLGVMNMLLLKKVEELTLYTIHQEEKIKQLEEKNSIRQENLENEIDELRQLIAELK